MSKKNTNNIDQIRDIIFGSEIKAFEKRFARLETAIEEINEKIEQRFDELDDAIAQEFKAVHKRVEKKIENLTHSTQKEQTKLKEQIATIDTDLHRQLKDQKEKFSAKLKAVKEAMAADKIEVTFRMKKMISETERVLQQDIKSLHEEQLSRKSMAQMLLTMAEELQNSDDLTLSQKRKETS